MTGHEMLSGASTRVGGGVEFSRMDDGNPENSLILESLHFDISFTKGHGQGPGARVFSVLRSAMGLLFWYRSCRWRE